MDSRSLPRRLLKYLRAPGLIAAPFSSDDFFIQRDKSTPLGGGTCCVSDTFVNTLSRLLFLLNIPSLKNNSVELGINGICSDKVDHIPLVLLFLFCGPLGLDLVSISVHSPSIITTL